MPTLPKTWYITFMKTIDCVKELLPLGGEGHIICGASDVLPDALVSVYKEKIQLVYLDPPFCTGRSFSAGAKESGRTLAYSDRFPFDEYMSLMRSVLTACRELLAPDGSIYLHIDYRMSAHMRLLLDEIFGADRFINEIIWAYNSGGRAKSHFPRKHDTIFLYGRSPKPYFNLEALGTPRGALRRNNMKRGIDPDGRVFYSIFTSGKLYKYYEDDPVYPSDVWNDIEHLHQRDKERLNYPTQKPEALLERIISASSREGDFVLDLFSGSGVTAAAAHKLNRRWFACDISPIAVATLRLRLIRDAHGKHDAEKHGALFEYAPPSNELVRSVRVTREDSRVTVESDERNLQQLSSGRVENGVFIPTDFAINPSGTNSLTVNTDADSAALHLFTNDGKRVVVEI